MAKLSPTDWLEIKTRYELGHNVRKIADDYKYDAGNLVKKAKKEGWEHGRIQHPIQEATRLIAEVTTNLQQPEMDVVKREINDRLKTVSDLMRDMNTFISLASKMNIDVMLEAQNMDTVSKTMVLSKLKGTMPELANMVGIQKEIAINDSEDENSLVTVKLVD